MLFVRRLNLNLRHLHTTTVYKSAETVTAAPAKYNKNDLGKLRKKTGFSISKCKNALEKFGDFKEAEKWLREQAQKEGWSKASKLQDRNMTQGLIGICVEGNKAAMVELNCETDFVAKNPKFQGLVSQVVKMCLSTASNVPGEHLYMNPKQINQLQEKNHSRTLADLVALEIGNIGENMAVKRGCVLHAEEGQNIGVYSHSSIAQQGKEVKMGKFGALVLFTGASDDSKAQLGHNLAMHIVGMNPLTVGDVPITEPNEIELNEIEENKHIKKKKKKKSKRAADEETVLLRQRYLTNEKITIADLLLENSATVESFVRYECGETLEEDWEDS